jgi:esterase/lipase
MSANRNSQNRKAQSAKTVQMSTKPEVIEAKAKTEGGIDLNSSLERIKMIRKEMETVSTKMQDLNATYTEAMHEEQKVIDLIKKDINEICDKYGMFCGVVLTQQDVLGIVQTALAHKGETVEIPYHLYFKK